MVMRKGHTKKKGNWVSSTVVTIKNRCAGTPSDFMSFTFIESAGKQSMSWHCLLCSVDKNLVLPNIILGIQDSKVHLLGITALPTGRSINILALPSLWY